MAPKATSKKRKAEEVVETPSDDSDAGSGTESGDENESDSEEEDSPDERPAKSKSSKAKAAATPKKSVKESASKKKGKETPNNKGSSKKAAGAKTPKTPGTPGTASKRRKIAPKDIGPVTALQHDADTVLPVDVNFEGESSESAQIDGAGSFKHVLRLSAPSSFGLIKTVVLKDGEFQGQQAIIIRPAVPFRFEGLPDKVRDAVYEILFAHENMVREPIPIESKKSKNGKLFAKVFSNKDPNRLAILAVNKKINNEASSILYSHELKFDNTASVTDFMVSISPPTILKLKNVRIQVFSKSNGRIALSLLGSAHNLTRLTIDKGATADNDAKKAAKAFALDVSNFVESHSIRNREATIKGVDILHFGPNALANKDNTIWTAEKRAEFLTELKARLK